MNKWRKSTLPFFLSNGTIYLFWPYRATSHYITLIEHVQTFSLSLSGNHVSFKHFSFHDSWGVHIHPFISKVFIDKTVIHSSYNLESKKKKLQLETYVGKISSTILHWKYFHYQKYNVPLCPNFECTFNALGAKFSECHKCSGSHSTLLSLHFLWTLTSNL